MIKPTFSHLKFATVWFTSRQFNKLYQHLYPGDKDEHAAVLLAGIHKRGNGELRLLVREVCLAKDGVDWIPAKSGRAYRQLNAEFIHSKIDDCVNEQLVYLYVHNHFSDTTVDFSKDDLRSHKKGYPALLDILDGLPMGALVFGKKAVAGHIWLPGKRIIKINRTIVTGNNYHSLTPKPARQKIVTDETYDRQTRIFGEDAQQVLKNLKIGIVGLGGVGSIAAELLGRIGVGNFLLIDPDIVEKTNLPRLIAASFADLRKRKWYRFWKTEPESKVNLAKKNILRANPNARVSCLKMDVCELKATEALLRCDYIFMAADSHSAKLLVNAIAYQYFIPFSQIGSKVQNKTHIFTTSRMVTPESGCLYCNQCINPSLITQESKSDVQLATENYGLSTNEPAPSLISLNAVSTSEAVNSFLFYILGMSECSAASWFMVFRPLERSVERQIPRSSVDCVWCSNVKASQFARGSLGKRLPCKP